MVVHNQHEFISPVTNSIYDVSRTICSLMFNPAIPISDRFEQMLSFSLPPSNRFERLRRINNAIVFKFRQTSFEKLFSRVFLAVIRRLNEIDVTRSVADKRPPVPQCWRLNKCFSVVAARRYESGRVDEESLDTCYVQYVSSLDAKRRRENTGWDDSVYNDGEVTCFPWTANRISRETSFLTRPFRVDTWRIEYQGRQKSRWKSDFRNLLADLPLHRRRWRIFHARASKIDLIIVASKSVGTLLLKKKRARHDEKNRSSKICLNDHRAIRNGTEFEEKAGYRKVS